MPGRLEIDEGQILLERGCVEDQPQGRELRQMLRLVFVTAALRFGKRYKICATCRGSQT